MVGGEGRKSDTSQKSEQSSEQGGREPGWELRGNGQSGEVTLPAFLIRISAQGVRLGGDSLWYSQDTLITICDITEF